MDWIEEGHEPQCTIAITADNGFWEVMKELKACNHEVLIAFGKWNSNTSSFNFLQPPHNFKQRELLVLLRDQLIHLICWTYVVCDMIVVPKFCMVKFKE